MRRVQTQATIFVLSRHPLGNSPKSPLKTCVETEAILSVFHIHAAIAVDGYKGKEIERFSGSPNYEMQ